VVEERCFTCHDLIHIAKLSGGGSVFESGCHLCGAPVTSDDMFEPS
jgi:hypothetical protein